MKKEYFKNNKFYSLMTILTCLFIISISLSPALHEFFRFDRVKIVNGHIYRLFSSIYTHFNLKHLIYDLGTFIIFSFFILKDYKKHILYIMLLNMFFVPLVVFIYNNDIGIFCGLSSIDVSLWVFAALILFLKKSRIIKVLSIMSIFGLTAKLIYEGIFKGSIFSSSYEFETLVSAHITGAIIGLFVFSFAYLRNRTELNFSHSEKHDKK